MFYDFEFIDERDRISCTRGVREPTTGSATNTAWWYLTIAGGEPAPLGRAHPGESHADVWQAALRYLDARHRCPLALEGSAADGWTPVRPTAGALCAAAQ